MLEVTARTTQFKRPFFRQTLTIQPPWDPGSDVTIEVIILDQTDEHGAWREAMLPELMQAGWFSQTVKALDVFVRVIG